MKLFIFVQFKDLMLSVDPPDEDDSDEEHGQQQQQRTGTPRPSGETPRQTIELAPDGAAPVSKPLPDGVPGSGGAPGRTEPMVNGDDKGVIEIDEEGDAEPSNFDKESPSSVSVSCSSTVLLCEKLTSCDAFRKSN